MKEKKYTVDPDSIGFFNLARGIGIIYVLLGHSILLFYPMYFSREPFGNASSILSTGCMTLFFLISGYGFRNRRMGKCIKIQAKLLLKPYLFTVVCILGAKLALAFLRRRSFWKYGGQYIFSYLFAINKGVEDGYKGTILGLDVDHVAMMWFFWALFGGWVICNAITQVKSRTVRCILIVLCACAGVGMTYISPIWPFVLPHMLQAAGFIFMGRLIREYHLLERAIPKWFYIIMGMVIMVSLIGGGVDIYSCEWKLGVIDYLSVDAVGFLYMRFFVWFEQSRKRGKLYDMISCIGEKTQIILCIHAFDEKVIPWYRLTFVFTEKNWIGSVVCFLIRCLFIFAAYQIVCFINKKFFRRLRKKRKHIKLYIQE